MLDKVLPSDGTAFPRQTFEVARQLFQTAPIQPCGIANTKHQFAFYAQIAPPPSDYIIGHGLPWQEAGRAAFR